MPNPLTITTTAPAMGDKTGGARSKESDAKSGNAFEDVLKEDVESNELAGVELTTADTTAPSEPPEDPAGDSVESPKLVKTEEPETIQPQVALQEVPSSAGQQADRVAAPANPSDRPAGPAALDPQLAPDRPAPKQKTDPPATAAPGSGGDLRRAPNQVPGAEVSQNRALQQVPDRLALNTAPVMVAHSRFSQPAPEPEARLVTRAIAPAGKPMAQQVFAAAAAHPQRSAQKLSWNPGDGIADGAIIRDTDEASSVRDITTSHTLRDTMQTMPIPMARVETARTIATQMAAAISARPGSGGVEIALNPEELGRVSITLNGREDGFFVTIAAERPETLDLMRRHIAILSAEFEKLGYGNLSFDLGMSGGSAQHGDPTEAEPSPDMAEMGRNAEHPASTLPIGPDRGLDMRL